MRILNFPKKINYLPIIFLFLIWIIFSFPFLFLGKAAYPATYQVNAFPPWSTYSEFAGPVKNNAQPDIITQIYPWRHFTVEEMKKGRIAFWNPYSFAGTPHLANYQSAVLFPLNLLFFAPLKFITVWSFLVVLQPLLAGLATYLFVRKLSVSHVGSLIASVSFMFCGFLVTWMGYATLGFAILPLPFALFAIEKYLEKKEVRWLILLSLTFPFSFFSGHFQTSIYFAFGVIAYVLYWLFVTKKWRDYFMILFFIFFGVLMVMPQVLPSMEFYLQTIRSSLFQKSEAIPWGYLPTLIAPDYFGNPVTRNDWFGHYAEWNGFSGSIALSLAIFTSIFRRNRNTIFFIILALITLLLAYNTPLLSILVQLKIPVISTSAASRIIVLFSFSTAVLAGFGYDTILDYLTKRKKLVIFWVFVVIGILAIIGMIPFMGIMAPEASTIAKKNMLLPIAFVFGLILLILLNLKFKPENYRYLLVAFILIAITFEMLRFATKWQSFENPDLVFKDVKTTKFYEQNKRVGRYFGEFTAENAVYYHMQTLGGYDPLYPGRYGEFVSYVGNGLLRSGERSVVNFPKKGTYTQQAIEYLGVDYIAHKVSDGNLPWAYPFSDYPADQFEKVYDDAHYQIYLNKKSYPRAFVVSDLIFSNNNQEILEKMFDTDLKKTAILEKKISTDQNSKGEAEIISYDPAKIIIDTKSEGKGFLVLTDNYYPGWKAKLNGINTEIFRTNYTFRGIEIPKGTSRIELKYLPESFLIGTYLFLVGWLGIIINIVYRSINSNK